MDAYQHIIHKPWNSFFNCFCLLLSQMIDLKENRMSIKSKESMQQCSNEC